MSNSTSPPATQSETVRLAIIGGGNMGTALAAGLLANGWPASDIAVVELLDSRRQALATELPGVRVGDAIPPCEGALIAVKPADVAAACTSVVAAGATRVLSIAAGITISQLQQASAPAVVVRAMPNTPALVGQGAAAICGGPTATDDDLAWAESILGVVGTVVRVDEKHLDAVTGLAGSGPAYLFLVAEALTDAGVLAGLPRPVAEGLVAQLFVGSARLLDVRGDPAALRAMVTSPGGTTAAGVRVLEEQAVRSAFLEAVMAASARSRELGG